MLRFQTYWLHLYSLLSASYTLSNRSGSTDTHLLNFDMHSWLVKFQNLHPSRYGMHAVRKIALNLPFTDMRYFQPNLSKISMDFWSYLWQKWFLHQYTHPTFNYDFRLSKHQVKPFFSPILLLTELASHSWQLSIRILLKKLRALALSCLWATSLNWKIVAFFSDYHGL